ncbi:hypothetical protein JRQ81_004302 [Phrynocephalus forsythii]|uniref:Insulin-like domain-containing protein n=1 Tax=Phrynocephalus forsythii TaxID=171643 RepID=A0A9Q0XFX9_9SAUR|nr:hypothetical protein JRQ81_004302 [Phrynocephalus forsythii]
MKKVNAIGLLSLCFLAALFDVKGSSPVRLCGRDFVRAVISACGEVHAKRQVQMDGSWDHTAESEGHLSFQDLDESQSFNAIPAEAKALQGAGRGSAKRRRDTSSLHAKCCTTGCRTADIHSLC